LGDVEVLDNWDIRSHTEVYDLAVCVGTVTNCPLAKKIILFVFGHTWSYENLDWDVAIVTSTKAQSVAQTAFGSNVRVFKCIPPLLMMEAGERRLRSFQNVPLHASCDTSLTASSYEEILLMAWWSVPYGDEIPFTPAEFNSLCLNGAYGVYDMSDGYDIQTRRHLALGSPVLCPCDVDVIGELADVCSDREPCELKQPIPDLVREEDYLAQLEEIMRRI